MEEEKEITEKLTKLDLNTEIKTIITLDYTKKAWEQSQPVIHNRWHPDIPPVASVKPGQVFRVETYDCTGGQIENNDSALDILHTDRTRTHPLSGPITVDGAEPGDYLEVEILEIQPIPGREWGFTGIYDANVTQSFLSDLFPHAAKAIWEFEGIYASSRHIPGIRFPGLPHPGVIGTAPSKAVLQEWNKRERELFNTEPDRVPPLALLPNEQGSIMGALELKPEVAREKAKEAARTIPPRENAGNVDIKNLSRGSKIWLPVYVLGANLSVGDMHFSEGDGEITLCGAIEMSGVITLKTSLIKNGMALHGNLSMPLFMPGPVEPRFSKYLVFEGISVDDEGKQHYLDASLSFRQACINAITYFKRFGYSGEQVYLFLSAMPVEGRINAIVDIPNACCSISIPEEVFDFQITPNENGHKELIKMTCPIEKSKEVGWNKEH